MFVHLKYLGCGFRVSRVKLCFVVLELARVKLLLFGFKSEPRKLFVKGLSVSLGNTWDLVLELAVENSCCGFRVSL